MWELHPFSCVSMVSVLCGGVAWLGLQHPLSYVSPCFVRVFHIWAPAPFSAVSRFRACFVRVHGCDCLRPKYIGGHGLPGDASACVRCHSNTFSLMLWVEPQCVEFGHFESARMTLLAPYVLFVSSQVTMTRFCTCLRNLYIPLCAKHFSQRW